MTESEIQARLLLAYGALPNARLFRNTVGFGYQGDLVAKDRGVVMLEKGFVVLRNARPVTFGLAPGSSDIVGWLNGRFVALEVKTQTGRASEQQLNFGEAVEKAGGLFRVVRSVADAESLFRK